MFVPDNRYVLTYVPTTGEAAESAGAAQAAETSDATTSEASE